ncbi:MAG: helix-turn-helix domain-containing protein [Chloroflexota bacterium]
MTIQTVDLTRASLRPWLADIVRSTRLLIGWTQADLARRAKTSQTTIWRLESGRADHIDLAATERVLAALGIAVTVSATMRHLADRERQRDAVHAVLNGSSARRHAGAGWRVITEAQIGDDDHGAGSTCWRFASRTVRCSCRTGDLPDFGASRQRRSTSERPGPSRDGWDGHRGESPSWWSHWIRRPSPSAFA